MEDTIVINGVTYVRQDSNERESFIEQSLKEFMFNFNFDKVQKVMEFLNWSWFSSEDPIPCVRELKECASRLLIECYNYCMENKSQFETGTGGFIARGFYDEETEQVWLRLSFSLAEWDNETLFEIA